MSRTPSSGTRGSRLQTPTPGRSSRSGGRATPRDGATPTGEGSTPSGASSIASDLGSPTPTKPGRPSMSAHVSSVKVYARFRPPRKAHVALRDVDLDDQIVRPGLLEEYGRNGWRGNQELWLSSSLLGESALPWFIVLATCMCSSSRPPLTHSLAHSSRSLTRSTQGQVRFGDRSTFRFDGVVMPDSTQTSVFGAVGQGAVQEVRTVVGGAVEAVEVVVGGVVLMGRGGTSWPVVPVCVGWLPHITYSCAP